MKTIKTNVYTFNELSDDAKEKARDWYKEGDDMPFLEEDMSEKLYDLLKESKIKSDDAEAQYSLSYCQGDGAMFKGTLYWKSYRVKVRHSGHYYHFNSKEIDIVSAKTDKEASEKIYKEFNDLYIMIAKKLERFGYDCIEYSRSNEAVDDNIIANEYTFTKEGKRFG